jgi:hypothetical protein
MVRPSEHAMNQNVELQKKNIELAHLYSDLQKSFEALCEINKKLREASLWPDSVVSSSCPSTICNP